MGAGRDTDSHRTGKMVQEGKGYPITDTSEKLMS